MSEISRELPIRFLCSIFTVPQEDAPELIRWGDKMIANQDPELSDAVPDQVDTEAYRLLPFRSPAAYEVWAYADRQKELRRQGPTDDVISALTVAQDEGRLNDHDFHNYFSLLMIAGNETTRHTITSGMLALMQDPEQMQLLKDDPSLISNATEEILRWATPVLHFRRTATRDVELRGQQIKAGDKVVTWYISANRDEEQFADPYRFDVTRRPNDHVTFGPGGPHFCLGAHLARLETKILFQELLPRLASIELAGPVERIRSNFVNGIKRMPVRVDAQLVHDGRVAVPFHGAVHRTQQPGQRVLLRGVEVRRHLDLLRVEQREQLLDLAGPGRGQRHQDHAAVARVLLPPHEPPALERGDDPGRGGPADADGRRRSRAVSISPQIHSTHRPVNAVQDRRSAARTFASMCRRIAADARNRFDTAHIARKSSVRSPSASRTLRSAGSSSSVIAPALRRDPLAQLACDVDDRAARRPRSCGS